jgi:hypothetical protein
LVRVGQVEEARSRLRSRPIDVGDEHWGWSMDVSLLGELAAAFRDPVLARQVRDHLAPLAGRMALSGFSVSVGPVDGYLALAEAVLAADGSGRPAAASAYADAAERLAGVWDFPLYVRWLRGQREAFGF